MKKINSKKAIENSVAKAARTAQTGYNMFHKGEYAKAIKYYTKSIALNPEDSQIHFRRGEAYAAFNHPNAALEDFTTALKLGNDSGICELHRGLVFHGLEDYGMAEHEFIKATKLPFPHEAYYFLGSYRAMAKDYISALKYFDWLVDDDHVYIDVYCERGCVKQNMGDCEGAIADLSIAKERDSKNAWAIFCRGQCYATLSKKKEARRDFTRAKKLDMNLVDIVDAEIEKLVSNK